MLRKVRLLPTSHFELIVVGGGVAGTQAALEAKKLKPQRSVALVSDEVVTYSRPSLTALISGAVDDPGKIGIFSSETLDSSGVQLLSGHEIFEIEHSAHTVYVKKKGEEQSDCASRFTYDRLIIATGATPLIPKTEGMGLHGVFTVRKFKEALVASKFVSCGMKAHVVGGGFVGLDSAEALARKGLDVTLIVRSRVLRGILEQDLSWALVERARMNGVKILSGVTLEMIKGDKKVECVVIDGRTLESDIVVFATGVKPDTRLAQSMGLITSESGAVKTDRSMQTNIKGVYATGDCSESIDFVSGKSVYRPLGSIAAQTAKIAAANAACVEKTYEGIIRSQYDRIFNTEIVSIGLSLEEAKSLNMRAKALKVRLKKPELLPFHELVSKNMMRVIVNEDTDVTIGWQVVGIRQSSLFSRYFYDCIFHRRTLQDMESSGLTAKLVFEQE